jgi:hypothetical protein
MQIKKKNQNKNNLHEINSPLSCDTWTMKGTDKCKIQLLIINSKDKTQNIRRMIANENNIFWMNYRPKQY